MIYYHQMQQSFNAKDIVLQQVDEFVNVWREANKKRRIPRPTADYTYIENFFTRVIADRNKRADAIDSEAHAKVINMAQILLPYPTYLEQCMDGRLFGPLLGLYGGIGHTLSVAGGILHEFVRREEDQQLELLPNSNFAQLLKKYLNAPGVTGIVEVLDSHIGCAARESEEIAKGKNPADHGLLSDVLLKLEMCNAMIAYVKKTFHGEKAMYPINISTDPHNGFMYMGLATERAFRFAEEHGGFTEEVLNTLVQKEWVFSTRHFAQDPQVEKLFATYSFPIDITHQYTESAHEIWSRVEKIKDQLLPFIKQKLFLVYPHVKDNKDRQKEMQERALVLLVNAFTGYLHQQYPNYPYAEHHEEGVFVSKGNNPPYEIAMFGESSLDMKNLPSNIELAASIVRNNRKSKRVVDASGIFSCLEDFIAAPVGVILQVKVLDPLPAAEWKKFLQINWSDVQDISWDTMHSSEFFNYLEDKAGDIPLCVVNAINKLRRRMAILYDVQESISSRLVDHDSIVLPIISDVNMRVRFIVPFLKTGLS